MSHSFGRVTSGGCDIIGCPFWMCVMLKAGESSIQAEPELKSALNINKCNVVFLSS